MKILKFKYAGNVSYVGTRRYVVYEVYHDEEKLIATIYSQEKDIKIVADEYAKAKREDNVILEYNEEDNNITY